MNDAKIKNLAIAFEVKSTWCYFWYLFQIVLLIGGIGWGNAVTRKIIYWGMLTGDILLVAIQAAFVHSMSTWNVVNLSIVVLASTFALFRMITLICNPRWWLWVPEPNFWSLVLYETGRVKQRTWFLQIMCNTQIYELLKLTIFIQLSKELFMTNILTLYLP